MRLLAVLIAALCLATAADAANWPQWRGPFLNGSTDETGLPARWGKTENRKWTTPLPGQGYSTPIVWENRVFLTALSGSTAKGDDAVLDVLALCLDADSGKVVWTRKLGPNRWAMGRNPAACNSAVTDGKAVWFYTGTGSLAAYDFAGKPLWARELEKDYGRFVVKWGYHSSPLLYGGKLYIPVLQNKKPTEYGHPAGGRTGPLDSFLLALDPKTGKTLWKHVRPTDATEESTEAYITPMPFEGADRREIILMGGEHATGHDAETGAELWRWEFTPSDRQVWQRVVTSPVAGAGLIFIQRPKHRTLYALKPGAKGKVGNELLAWKFDGPTPDSNTPLIYRGRLYAVDGDKKGMTCLDARTGRQIWQHKLQVRGPVRASVTGADGKLYLISEGGEALVLDAGDAYKELFRTMIGERKVRASIVAAQGRLLIRTDKAVHCMEKAP